MTTIPSAGDPDLVPAMLEAARAYEPLPADEQAGVRERDRDGDSPVPAP